MNLSIDRLNFASPTKSNMSIINGNKNTLNFINNYSLDQGEEHSGLMDGNHMDGSGHIDDTQLQHLNNLLAKENLASPDNTSDNSNLVSESQIEHLRREAEREEQQQETRRRMAQEVLDQQKHQMLLYMSSLKKQNTD